MRITILAVGTRGDVQPYVALGVRLRTAGHDVCVATCEPFREFVSSQGLRFFLLSGDPQKYMTPTQMESGRNLVVFWQQIFEEVQLLSKQFLTDSLNACSSAEAVLFSPLGGIVAQDIASHLGIPFFATHYLPLFPTRAFPHFFFPPLPGWVPFRSRYNLLTYGLNEQVFWQFFRRALRRLRKELPNLPRTPLLSPYRRGLKVRNPVLYAFSPSVLPRPDDWGDWIQITGYWFLEQTPGWQPSSELLDFLAAGTPPVYIGFGSIVVPQPEVLSRLLLEALALAGQRAILMKGWGGLSSLSASDHVLVLDSAPHGWLFPRMSAVVHHGGASTTAAGLRAGVPSIIVPFFADQFFWGECVSRLGVGPSPVPYRRLTVERLAAAIRAATRDAEMRSRAAALSRCIREEDGLTRAVELIENHVGDRRFP